MTPRCRRALFGTVTGLLLFLSGWYANTFWHRSTAGPIGPTVVLPEYEFLTVPPVEAAPLPVALQARLAPDPGPDATPAVLDPGILVSVGKLPTPVLTASVIGLAATSGAGPHAALASWVSGTTHALALRFTEAERHIQNQSWAEAARVLHGILGAPEETFVPRPQADGRSLPLLIGARFEASRLLGTLPAPGLAAYRQLATVDAAESLRQAKEKADPARLANVAVRYLYTPAGTEAVFTLFTYYQVRGDATTASLWFARLFDRGSPDAPAPLALYKAALAAYRAGAPDKGDAAWQQLADTFRKDGGLTIDGQFFAVKTLRDELIRAAPAEARALTDWPMFRGGPGRSEPVVGGAPLLEATWTESTLPPKTDVKNWTEENLASAVRYLQDEQKQPVLPAFFPIAVQGKIIYRTYDGVYARSLKLEGKLDWYSHTDGGVLSLLNDASKKGYLEQWNGFYRQNGPRSILYENSANGSLSTDGTRAFIVDDLAIPPHPYVLRNFGAFGPQPNFGSLSDLVNRNSLKAYSLDNGKLIWEQSGKFDTNSPLASSVFLGPPLPLEGKLYVLNEKDHELRLACLEVKDTPARPQPPDVIWMLSLGRARTKVQLDLRRRMHATHIACADRILVCPTDAGVMIGVDLLSHSLRWAHVYPRVNAPTEPVPRFGMPKPVIDPITWRASAPAIQDGKVIFTAPDSAAMHCLNLHDGDLRWSVPKGADDVYFAGIVAGRALIVGRSHCRAIDLINGREAWRLDNIGTPSGQGAAAAQVYYLPLKSGPDKEPEVCAIDVAQGKVIARTRSPKKEVPGNLIFHRGEVLSQNLTEISSYPQIMAKLNRIDQRLEADPKDGGALFERGELRLAQGQAADAVADFRAALKNQPLGDPAMRTRQGLFEALTEWLRQDFAAAEKQIGDYRELCRAERPAEHRRRIAVACQVAGRGYEQQGRPLEALQLYLDFSAVADDKELMSSPEAPNLRVSQPVWVRGRIDALYKKATPEQRKQMDEKTLEHLKRLNPK